MSYLVVQKGWPHVLGRVASKIGGRGLRGAVIGRAKAARNVARSVGGGLKTTFSNMKTSIPRKAKRFGLSAQKLVRPKQIGRAIGRRQKKFMSGYRFGQKAGKASIYGATGVGGYLLARSAKRRIFGSGDQGNYNSDLYRSQRSGKLRKVYRVRGGRWLRRQQSEDAYHDRLDRRINVERKAEENLRVLGLNPNSEQYRKIKEVIIGRLMQRQAHKSIGANSMNKGVMSRVKRVLRRAKRPISTQKAKWWNWDNSKRDYIKNAPKKFQYVTNKNILRNLKTINLRRENPVVFPRAVAGAVAGGLGALGGVTLAAHGAGKAARYIRRRRKTRKSIEVNNMNKATADNLEFRRTSSGKIVIMPRRRPSPRFPFPQRRKPRFPIPGKRPESKFPTRIKNVSYIFPRKSGLLTRIGRSVRRNPVGYAGVALGATALGVALSNRRKTRKTRKSIEVNNMNKGVMFRAKGVLRRVREATRNRRISQRIADSQGVYRFPGSGANERVRDYGRVGGAVAGFARRNAAPMAGGVLIATALKSQSRRRRRRREDNEGVAGTAKKAFQVLMGHYGKHKGVYRATGIGAGAFALGRATKPARQKEVRTHVPYFIQNQEDKPLKFRALKSSKSYDVLKGKMSTSQQDKVEAARAILADLRKQDFQDEMRQFKSFSHLVDAVGVRNAKKIIIH